MDYFEIVSDIHLVSIVADSYPEGIGAAHQKLHSLVQNSPHRKFYGISKPFNEKIIYQACAELLDHETAENLGGEAFILPKGIYKQTIIKDFLKKPWEISSAFDLLLQDPNLDPASFCVEFYFNDFDVACLVKVL